MQFSVESGALPRARNVDVEVRDAELVPIHVTDHVRERPLRVPGCKSRFAHISLAARLKLRFPDVLSMYDKPETWRERTVPSQGWMPHLRTWFSSPRHSSPPNSGWRHTRARRCSPPPHVLEHSDHPPHGPHSPSTANRSNSHVTLTLRVRSQCS